MPLAELLQTAARLVRSRPPMRWQSDVPLAPSQFQRELIELLLSAFPEKRRLLFVHIPKCSGTHLRETLRPHYPLIDLALTEPPWTNPRRLFDLLETLLPQLRAADTLVVHGHIPLHWYMEVFPKRPGDRILTVLRDPVDVVLSHANYVASRISLNPGADSPDVRHWLDALGWAPCRRISDTTGSVISPAYC